MLDDQDHRCKICRADIDTRAPVDHNHVTGKIRGILCRGCNTGIGCFRDQPRDMREAARYVDLDGEI